MSAVIEGKGGFRTWLNKRLPVDQFVADQLTGYYAPKNFNVWYFFGSLALLMFVMQIVTGIFVTMHFRDTKREPRRPCVIFLRRTKNVGVVPRERLLDLGVTGPLLRAAGEPWDLRKVDPTLAYADFDFNIPVNRLLRF